LDRGIRAHGTGELRARDALRASGWAWAALAIVAGFIAISWWWVSRDLGVPSADAGSHLFTAAAYHDRLAGGDIADLWTRSGYYPPLTFVVGGLSMFVGGRNPGAPVVGQNLVYVSLLAAGCYGTGRLLAGPQAGFLAVLFALGSPLLIEQFHVFMIDAPQAAVVAASVWLILASERFSRVGVAALAGFVVGLGLNSKEQFPLFIAGFVAVVLLRESGWRNWRGILAFVVVALAVGAPWYVVNWDQLGWYASAGLANANLPARGKPPLLSVANAGWYVWAVLNGLLFAPLFAFAAIGLGKAISASLQARSKSREYVARWRPELLAGLGVGWIGITFTPHHDMRYAMPMIVYLAVLGTAWIPALTRVWRRTALVLLGAAVLATTLGATFGVGHEVRILLAGRPIATDVSFGIPAPSQITIYSDHDFVVSAPRRESDVAGFFAALRDSGVTAVAWEVSTFEVGDRAADPQGLVLLAGFAGLRVPVLGQVDLHDPRNAYLTHGVVQRGDLLPPPCLRLGDGTGVWVSRGYVRGDPQVRYVCPAR
jgi:hypothetical protein